MPPVSPTGPVSSTPYAASRSAASRPASSSARRPSQRDSPPSAATQAATFAAWPPAARVVREFASAPTASGCSRRTITSSTRSPSEQTSMAYDPRMDGNERRSRRLRSFVIGGVVGAGATVAALRRDRRRRRSDAPTGLGAFESAPCYRELSKKSHGDGVA
jgi:hypothetical protein